MKRFFVSAAVLALLAAPALADSSVNTTTETTRTVTVPEPVPPAQSTTTYGSSTTHTDDGVTRTDTRSDTYVAPDGSTSTKTKVIEQEKH